MVCDIIPNPGFAPGIDIGVEPYKFPRLLGAENPHCATRPAAILLPSIDAFCGRELELPDKLGIDTGIPD